MLKATAIQPKIDLKTSTIQKPNLKEPLDGFCRFKPVGNIFEVGFHFRQ